MSSEVETSEESKKADFSAAMDLKSFDKKKSSTLDIKSITKQREEGKKPDLALPMSKLKLAKSQRISQDDNSTV